MNELELDEHLQNLHRLADQVSAPPSDAARQAIGRRTRVLRRRRRTRQAVGSGVLVLAVVAGVLASRGDERHGPDVGTGPANPGEAGEEDEGSLPAITLEADGWEVVDAREDHNTEWDAGDGLVQPGFPGSLQVFRRPGQLDGPTVVVEHTSASDAVPVRDGEQPVEIDGGVGALRPVDARRFTLSWNTSIGDSQAFLQAFGLTEDQVVEFARGLRVRDEDLGGFPPGPDDRYGFDATAHPAGIEEDPTGSALERADFRRVKLSSSSGTVDITIDNRGEAAFEHDLGSLLMAGPDVEQVSIEGQPALLVDEGGGWSLLWRHDDANVGVLIQGVDRSAVDEIVDGLREISEDEWRDMREWAM